MKREIGSIITRVITDSHVTHQFSGIIGRQKPAYCVLQLITCLSNGLRFLVNFEWKPIIERLSVTKPQLIQFCNALSFTVIILFLSLLLHCPQSIFDVFWTRKIVYEFQHKTFMYMIIESTLLSAKCRRTQCCDRIKMMHALYKFSTICPKSWAR